MLAGASWGLIVSHIAHKVGHPRIYSPTTRKESLGAKAYIIWGHRISPVMTTGELGLDKKNYEDLMQSPFSDA